MTYPTRKAPRRRSPFAPRKEAESRFSQRRKGERGGEKKGKYPRPLYSKKEKEGKKKRLITPRKKGRTPLHGSA